MEYTRIRIENFTSAQNAAMSGRTTGRIPKSPHFFKYAMLTGMPFRMVTASV
jgi:hypothetical protein